MTNKIKIFSFFSGSGFLDYGFEKSGYEICFVNEFKESFINAYKYSRNNLGIKSPIYGYSQESIEIFLKKPLNEDLKKNVENEQQNSLVGFIGGPPCPDFSVGGKNKGEDGENGKLSGTYIDLICKVKPDFFVFENVKGLWRTKRHREFFEKLKNKLHKNGYSTTENLVNAIEYGVPQDRDRIILFGILKKNLNSKSICDFDWGKKIKYKRNDVLNVPLEILKSKYPELTVKHWFKKNNVSSHQNANDVFVPRAGLQKFQTVAEGDVSKKSYKRLHRHYYSPTACYGNNEVHIHPFEPRRITVAEALAIQSLPANFVLPKEMTLTDKFKTVGNGVPFHLAKGIAQTVKSFLKDL